jgi:hypothetical protein
MNIVVIRHQLRADMLPIPGYPRVIWLDKFLRALRREVGDLELARIGSLLFIFANSPSDQIGDEEPIDTFATRLSAESLKRLL